MQAQNHDGKTRQVGLEAEMVVTNEFKQVTPLVRQTDKRKPHEAKDEDEQGPGAKPAGTLTRIERHWEHTESPSA